MPRYTKNMYIVVLCLLRNSPPVSGGRKECKTKRIAWKKRAKTAEASLAECETQPQNEDDGSVAGVDQCFKDGGNCASCYGACTITTDLENTATTETCVCYEASSAPSGMFRGTENNDCVFIEADDVYNIWVRSQCLGRGAEEVLAPSRRGSRCSGRVESMRP